MVECKEQVELTTSGKETQNSSPRNTTGPFCVLPPLPFKINSPYTANSRI